MSKRTDSMYATIIGIALALFLVFTVVVIVRVVFGGPEDTWVCSGGQWVMHGKPTAQHPALPCTP